MEVKKIAGVLVFLLLFSTNNLIVFAKEKDPELEKIKIELIDRIPKHPLTQCRQALVPLFDIELKEFFEFLETNFQNKGSNSSLTNIAIARFKDYKDNLNDYFTRLSPSYDSELGGNSPEAYASANASFLACDKIKDEYLYNARKILISHIKTTSASKKASVLLDKYQAINSRLRDLNMEISQLYGYFMAFKAKLPGFLQQCIKS